MLDGEQSFLVEDFVESIAAQLDQVQDTLRLKSLNRPLTYALRDFSLDLNVFVTMDAQGKVRFRTSAPNEEGASTVKIGFTTITRPMIEENTVELSLTRSPTLDELGLEPDEQRQLHKLGVRNAAQLDRLHQRTGTATVSRFSGIKIDRLRQAIQFGKPRIDRIRPERPSPKVTRPTPKTSPRVPPRHPDSGSNRGDILTPKPYHPPTQPAKRNQQNKLRTPPKLADARKSPILTAPGVDRLRFIGKNLLGAQGLPYISLNDIPLDVLEADDDEMVLGLPTMPESGLLYIEMPNGEAMELDLIMTDSSTPGSLSYDYPDEYIFSNDEIDDDGFVTSDDANEYVEALSDDYYDDSFEYDDAWAPRARSNGRNQR